MRLFSEDRLEKLLKKGRNTVFWRHDVDFSLKAAVKMAEFEQKLGIKATFYLFLAGDNPFYSLREAIQAEQTIYDLGHRIGVHVDERKVTGLDDGTHPFRGDISFHCPTPNVLWRDFSRFENAYASAWKGRYYADSNGNFSYGEPEDDPRLGKEQLQVNLHPEWWFEKGWYREIDDETYKSFFYVEKPYYVDARSGRPVRDGQKAVWAFDPRPWSPHVALWVSPRDYNAVIDRGYATIDGQRAVPFLQACDESVGFLRLVFESGAYRLPEGREEVQDVRMMETEGL